MLPYEESNRATAPQRRNQQSSGLLVSPREIPVRGNGSSPFPMRFGPTYGNCCAGDRRLRRMQGAGAGPRAAEAGPVPRDPGRCEAPAPGTGRRGRFPTGYQAKQSRALRLWATGSDLWFISKKGYQKASKPFQV